MSKERGTFHIHETVDGLNNGNMKECPKCEDVKSLSDFMDNSLVTGYGRFCMDCKNKKNRSISSNSYIDMENEDKTGCPVCGSDMVVRSGKYGKFFGCSKYPYCRGTKKF